MTAELTLNIERLVAPISEEHPSGSYLKDTDYNRLQEAKDLRAKAVASERKQRALLIYSEEDLGKIPEQDRYVEPPNWRSVRDICVDILENHSKDLWVATWLVEANTRLAGFAGMRDAFRVIEQIVKQFWSDIYPPPDEEEGYLGTVSQLTSLNGDDGPGMLIVPINEVPLIPAGEQYTSAAYEQAIKRPGGDLTEGQFFAAARSCDQEALRSYGNGIQEAIDSYAAMIQSLEERCGEVAGMPVAPPSSNVRRELTECLRRFKQITDEILGVEASEGELMESDESGGSTVAGGAVSVAQSPVSNREDAFRLLLKVSEFFRKTEPHSPVSYMLQQAVSFGRMTLPDLLKELIDNEEVLTRFAERTGIEIKKDVTDE